MAHRKTLSQAQLDLLQWIADGCPEGVMEGDSHRISAAALRRRGLVKISGRGPGWRAAITPAGRACLEQAKTPEASPPRQANASVTEELVASVSAAGGALRVPHEIGPGVTDYFQRAQAAMRHGKVPAGKRLTVNQAGPRELEIRLDDAIPGTEIDARSVPVPERVGRYHPVVKRFREQSDRHEVSRAALPRALRILQGVAAEAEARGHEVSNIEGERGRYSQYDWTGPRDGHLLISVRGHAEPLRISEEGLPSRSHWERQQVQARPWFDRDRPVRKALGEFEANATGRLCIELVPGYRREGRATKWADRKSWTLEEKLGEMLREIEIRGAEAEERERERGREAERRHHEWEQAMERAKARYLEDYRVKVLLGEVADWQRAQTIRDYCDAIEGGGDRNAAEWASWARQYADRIDPLQRNPAIPPDPESVELDALKPYLGGLSPYGPNRW